MERVGDLAVACNVCRAPKLLVFIGDNFEGIVLKCAVCGYDDFIANPFADIRILLDVPKNWCLVYNTP